MPTFSCYAGQVFLVGMLLGFAVFAANRTWAFTAWVFAVVALLTVLGWDCRYTMVCR